jgi:cbb3-type cytochrome oxidase subunit 3
LYFLQGLPDMLRNTGIVCIVLAGLHAVSAFAGQGLWLSAALEAVAKFLQKSARAIHDVIADIWDFFKDDPLAAGIGCLTIVFFIIFLGWIISMFTGGAWVAFFDEIDAFSEYLAQHEPADEIFLTQIILYSPLLVLMLLALIGTIWLVLSLTGKGIYAYAAFLSSPSPRQRQSIMAVILLLAGVGTLAGNPRISRYAKAQAQAILRSHLDSGDLRKFDLQNLNLSGIDLAGADLYGANLSEACLIGANLYNANLENARLTGACLDDANLADANLKKADLHSASLQNAILDDAFFWETNLTEADLRNASHPGRGPDLTILPDGTRTGIAGGPPNYILINTHFFRFTDPDHPKFWTPGNIPSPDSCQNALDY